MSDNSRQPGGKLPQGQPSVDPSTGTDLSETEGYQPSRMCGETVQNFSSPAPTFPHVAADIRAANAPGSNVSYTAHFQGPSLQHQFPGGQPFNVPTQQATAYLPGRGQPGGAFTMSAMAAALPDYQPGAHPHATHESQQRFPPGATPTASLNFPAPPISQFAGQTPVNAQGFSTYPSQFAAPYPHAAAVVAAQAYDQQQANQQSHPGGPSSTQGSYNTSSFFPGHQPQQLLYYAGQYGQGGVPPQGVQSGPLPSPYGRGSSHHHGQTGLPHQGGDSMGGRFPMYGGVPPVASVPYLYGASGSTMRSSAPAMRRGSTSGTGVIPSSPRGPPRKPKQSGHALWVGNLPSGANVSDLKDHFSKDATKTIESVFLISKSNCAFVNYRTDAACAAAMTRFHDSRFQGVRLVCRLRRSSTSPAPGVPTGPAALVPAVAQSQTAFEAIAQNRQVSSRAEELAMAGSSREGEGPAKIADKYFVMKSLTVEDMELSVRNGIWATQAHNEEALNKAFETAENVYLVFSANKSGEYFGFARMTSPITEAAASSLDWTPRVEPVIDDPDLPRSIPTAPTEFAPKGRIIDDSARGTIFWEADPEDEDIAPMIDGEVEDDEDTKRAEGAEGAEGAEDAEDSAAASGGQTFGKPFKIEWLATNRLPFYRTRGLRNPWNANREVKIARDGTELETSVGRRLIQMFQTSSTSPGPLPQRGWSPSRPY